MPMDRVVMSGHSAGGHLVAALFAAPRDRLRFDPARIVGGVPLSGVYDFEPLRHHNFNCDFRLDPAAVARLNLADKRPTVKAPLVIAAGADESSEFRRQSRVLADAWSGQVRSLLMLPGLHHFNIVDALAERGQPLHDAALGFLE
jgi:arylformamidase